MNPCVVSVCHDHAHPGFARLHRSLERYGWMYHHICVPWRGFATKLQETLTSLPALKRCGYTHIVFADAFDVLAQGTPANFMEGCEKAGYSGKGALLSCEKACWPDSSLEKLYPKTAKSEWKYINSGGYVSEIDFAGDVLLKECDKAGDDQLFLTMEYLADLTLNDSESIKRDDGCDVFQTLAHCVCWPGQRPEDFFDIKDGRVWNKATGTAPIFWHANGGGSSSNYHSWMPGF